MTNPTELLPCIYVRFADNGEIRKWDRKPFDGATEYHAAVSGLLPMATAPKDRTVILGVMRDDLPETDGGFSPHRWSGRIVPIRHEGKTVSDYDLGWSVALPVGHGGLPDDWFVGWVPVATALAAAPAPVASGEVEREDPIVLPPDETDIRLLRDGIVPGCPCCAGTPTTFARFFERSGIYQSYVNCSRCYVQVFVNSRDREEARKVALERWSKRSLTTPARAVSREEAVLIATTVCRDVAELPDRNSPDDWPEAMLVTAGELHQIVADAIIALIGGE